MEDYAQIRADLISDVTPYLLKGFRAFKLRRSGSAIVRTLQ